MPTSPRFDVLSYGTMGVDRVLNVPHWPHPDKSTHTTSEAIYLGGKATNTAAWLAAWDINVAVSGTTIGEDEIGARFFRLLEQYPGISTAYIGRRAGLASMYCCILIDPSGDRAIIGVNTDGNVPTLPTQEMIADSAVLTLDLYGGQERVDAARLAHDLARPVVIGDLRDWQHPILPYTTVAIASAAELRMTYSDLTLMEFAAMVRKQGTPNVIITDGAGAVTLFNGKEDQVQLSPPRVAVVDTTGAGDAFRAGVTYGVLKGWEITKSTAFGVAAGVINVQRAGGSSDPPTFSEVHSLAEQILQTAIRP